MKQNQIKWIERTSWESLWAIKSDGHGRAQEILNLGSIKFYGKVILPLSVAIMLSIKEYPRELKCDNYFLGR